MTRKNYLKFIETDDPLAEFLRSNARAGDVECADALLQYMIFKNKVNQIFGWELGENGKLLKLKKSGNGQ